MRSIFRRKRRAGGVSAIGFDALGVSAVGLTRKPDLAPTLEFCDFKPCQGDEERQAGVHQLVREHGLQRSICTTVLDSQDYQLLMTEAPKVPDSELAAALRWQVKDLLDIPIDEATLDVFNLPHPNTPEQGHPVYVVAARRAAVQQRVDDLTLAGANLQVIDIAEMAMRNLVSLLPENDKGVAMLWLRPQGGLITITRQGELYLSRALSVGLDGLRDEAIRELNFNQILLELQRSLDYFESQFRQAPIRHVALAPLLEPLPGLVEFLQENLGVQVATLDLEQILHLSNKKNLAEGWQARHFITIGAALRQESVGA